MRHLLLATVAALALAGCTTPLNIPSAEPTGTATTAPTPTTAPSPTTASGFAVTSADFTDGGELAESTTANAFNGQCTGDNENPDLSWSGAPEGTQSYAITMIDRSAANYIHWVHFDIPADVTGVARGESDSLAGSGSENDQSELGYFGPCPPGPDHRYEFTVYALDAALGLGDGASFVDLKKGIDEHVLAQATINGMRSGPGE
ncbi:YbhB/YbcL family Raf kinase inhibitor-like protein [Demequina sp.]|uniref:YbhB/YbcL family Raf kinase inhibitor-like protein n=1 Tax=Demequina sp. TaxID=2050685 RepID=UPI003D0AA75C